MNNPSQKSECPVAAGHYANQINNDLDFATGSRRRKAESNLCAILSLAGYCVYPLRDGGYLVAKYGYTYVADDISDLQDFALRLGVA